MSDKSLKVLEYEDFLEDSPQKPKQKKTAAPYKTKIIKVIDRFYVDCIEEFKEAELKIARDSRFRTMFRKKDYQGNVEMLRSCRKKSRSLHFPMGDIPKDDSESKELIRQTEKCIRQFNRMCDSYIQMQLALQSKAEGSGLSYKEYKDVYQRSQDDRVAMNGELKELDLLYADYTETEDYDF